MDARSSSSARPGIGGFIAPAANKAIASHAAAPQEPDPTEPLYAGEGAKELRGLIRDERGVRLAPEAED